MTPEQQRIAIAEACGWQLVTDNPLYEPYWEDPKGNKIGVSCGCRFPYYLNDLNAMHEAEKMLRKPMKGSDTDTIIGDRMHKYAELIGYAFDATAAQRAEAFLRTIDKWTINEPTEP